MCSICEKMVGRIVMLMQALYGSWKRDMSQLPLRAVSWKTWYSSWMSWPVTYQPRSEVISSVAAASSYRTIEITLVESRERRMIRSAKSATTPISIATVK